MLKYWPYTVLISNWKILAHSPNTLKEAKVWQKSKIFKNPYPISGKIDRLCETLQKLKLTEIDTCAADFSLLNLPKGKSLGRSKPATNS